jgi:hypothetical protein
MCASELDFPNTNPDTQENNIDSWIYKSVQKGTPSCYQGGVMTEASRAKLQSGCRMSFSPAGIRYAKRNSLTARQSPHSPTAVEVEMQGRVLIREPSIEIMIPQITAMTGS